MVVENFAFGGKGVVPVILFGKRKGKFNRRQSKCVLEDSDFSCIVLSVNLRIHKTHHS